MLAVVLDGSPLIAAGCTDLHRNRITGTLPPLAVFVEPLVTDQRSRRAQRACSVSPTVRLALPRTPLDGGKARWCCSSQVSPAPSFSCDIILRPDA